MDHLAHPPSHRPQNHQMYQQVLRQSRLMVHHLKEHRQTVHRQSLHLVAHHQNHPLSPPINHRLRYKKMMMIEQKLFRPKFFTAIVSTRATFETEIEKCPH
jgi:hypothetical protein